MTAWPTHRNTDPVTSLAALLNALDTDRKAARATAKRDESDRLRILMVHGLFALVVAPLFLVYSTTNGLTSASWTLLRSIPGAPHTVAAWLFTAGILVMLGSAAKVRRLAAAGLVLMAGWYLSFASTFTYAVWLWWHNGADPSKMPALYAGPAYAHFSVLVALQLITALRTKVRSEP